ncbi:unnamed protein product [Tetraodon nigroviridis]|uniref:Chromosome undetermined SCAF6252, whole genome shotgun sequence n=1 Tax=Tetraodon nigroviridis TaxID=99883 RepID=Q4TDH7_TETNG|nr:unnamed protein product [Tetraodon nigroviridis]
MSYTLLMLLAIFSAATGLKCRACGGDFNSCWTVDCLPKADRCVTVNGEGAVGCVPSSECGESLNAARATCATVPFPRAPASCSCCFLLPS